MDALGPLGWRWLHHPRRLLPIDVDSTRDLHRRGRLSRRIDAGHAGSGGTDFVPVAGLPRDRLVDQPADRAPRSAAHGRPSRFSTDNFAQDLGLFRDLRRRGRSLAATGQLSRASGCRGRSSHLTDQHGAFTARESVRLRLRLHSGRPVDRAHRECARHDGNPGTAPGSFLQLV